MITEETFKRLLAPYADDTMIYTSHWNMKQGTASLEQEIEKLNNFSSTIV